MRRQTGVVHLDGEAELAEHGRQAGAVAGRHVLKLDLTAVRPSFRRCSSACSQPQDLSCDCGDCHVACCHIQGFALHHILRSGSSTPSSSSTSRYGATFMHTCASDQATEMPQGAGWA